MKTPITPSKHIVESSSKLQQILMTRLQDPPMLSHSQKPTFFDSLKKKPQTEAMLSRMDARRHPMTGISGPRSRSNNRSNLFSKDYLTQSHKLNPRILETWLNSTVADAEDFNTPSSVLSSEKRLPLIRYKIDRSSLLAAGLPAIEIDRLYQSLFVHSIGFYQVILRVLEHTEKKYSIVTGIWKVYAVLLEYCCKLDYKMIISTLNLEKREELENLENEFKGQISLMEEQEKRLVEGMNTVKNKLKAVEKDLQKQIEKREELEDEIMQRGSGHEEEVAMRLMFESKLNQMYAKQRDLSTRLEQLTETVQEQQESLNVKSEQVAKEKKKANEMLQSKIEAEQELKKIDDRYKQLVLINVNLENRIETAVKKIDDLNISLGKTHLELSECMNEIAQKKIEIDDQRFENEICKGQILKLENVIQEHFMEKKIYGDRIAELQTTYAEEFEKNKHFEQEYIQIKESEEMFKVGFNKYKEKTETLVKVNETLEKERDKLAVALDSSVMMENEMKNQVRRSQEKIEEMNKGRRFVEEMNEHLKNKLEEKSNDLVLARQHVTELKSEIENLRTTEAELSGEITSLTIKIKSMERQFETTRETLQEKISNLNDILTSEKKIRENWIYRYEEEQKQLAAATKNLILTEDKLNEVVMKSNSLAIALQERNLKVEKYSAKNKELFEEVLNLRSLEEEFERKNKTLNVLMTNIEKDNKERILELITEFKEVKKDHMRDLERAKMMTEEVWHQAMVNFEALNHKLEELKMTKYELEMLKKDLEAGKAESWLQREIIGQNLMKIEDFWHGHLQMTEKHSDLLQEFKALQASYYDLHTMHNEWMNKIPLSLRNEKNPFIVLEDKINLLETEVTKLRVNKENMCSQETQYKFEPDSKDTAMQTEKDSDHERSQKKSTYRIENAEKGVQVNFLEVTRASITGSIDSSKDQSSLKKLVVEESVKSGSKHLRNLTTDFVHLEDELMTPVNLRSIYKHSEDVEEEKLEAMRLPSIGKKMSTSRPPTVPSILTTEIKRHIRQANSRRKNETTF